MSYNNTTPVLQDPNGSTSSLIYLTPDAVYENNGSGVLRIVQQASEETTSGQSITYYKIKPSGLAAYTVVAPIAAMRVVDGDSGKFKTVKFNLGAKYDIMVPFIYTFVKDLAATDQAKLFLAGAHISIYVAHYEVIEHAGMSWLTALVMIIIIVVIIAITIAAGGSDGGSTLQAFLTVVGGTASTAAVTAAIAVLKAKLITFMINMVVMQVIQRIIVEVVGDNELAMLLTLAAGFAVASWDIGVAPGSAPNTAQLGTYGHTGGATIGAGGGSLAVNTPAHYNPQSWFTPKITGATSFSLPSGFQNIASMAGKALDGVNTFYEYKLKSLNEELSTEIGAYEVLQEQRYKKLGELDTILAAYRPKTDSNYLLNATRVLNQGPKSAYAHDLIYLSLNKNQLKFAELDVSSHYNYDVHFPA